MRNECDQTICAYPSLPYSSLNACVADGNSSLHACVAELNLICS